MGECTPLVRGELRAEGRGEGRAVQIDPMKLALKAPGSMLMKLVYDEPLSTFAFKLNLRRYVKGIRDTFARMSMNDEETVCARGLGFRPEGLGLRVSRLRAHRLEAQTTSA